MKALLPFPVSEPLSPSLHRRCTSGALLTLLTCPATCSTQAGVRRLPVGRGRTPLCENLRQASVPGYHTHVPRHPASQGAWPPTSTPYFRRRNPPLICLFSKAQGCSTLLSWQQNPQSLQLWFPRSKPSTCSLHFSSRSPDAPSEAQDLTWTGSGC